MRKPMPDPGLTDCDRRALAVIDTFYGSFTTCELADRLYPTGARQRQCYARPAGKVIRRLVARGYVAQTVRPWGDGRTRTCFVRIRKEHADARP